MEGCSRLILARGIALFVTSASIACSSSGSTPGAASGPDAEPPTPDAGAASSDADASVPDADAAGPDVDASDSEPVTPDGEAGAQSDGSTCAGTAPTCPGVSCDAQGVAICSDGQWLCNGLPASPFGGGSFGCECFDSLTMGLEKCCPSLDGGPSAAPFCVVPDGGAGKVGSGTLSCLGGGTPYVAEAGASCR